MQTIELQVSKLKLWDKNPRQITEQDFEKLKASLEKNPEFLQKRPLLVNHVDGKYIVYAGNMRLRAVKALGWKTVHCIVEDDIPEERMNAEAIKDNVEYGTWDMDILSSNFGEDFLKQLDVPLREFGLADLENPEEDARKEEIEDEVPEVTIKIKVQQGDIFQLGRHRLMCGDSTSEDDVKKLMDGKLAKMIFTDPPYNVNYKGQGEKTKDGIMNDNMSDDQFEEFLDKVFARYKENVEDKAGVYVFHSTSTQAVFEKMMRANGFHIKNQLIWNKPMAALGWGDYRWKHEPFFYASSSEGGGVLLLR